MVKGKGTQSFGKRHTKVHNECRRCGRKTYHIQKHRCASCAYPKSRTRKYNWAFKVRNKRGEGTGRMRHMKVVVRKAKNNFRFGTKPKANKKRRV